jgi:hypothetical protein
MKLSHTTYAKIFLAIAKSYRWLEKAHHAKADVQFAKARKARAGAIDAEDQKHDAFSDYKLAVRLAQEEVVLEAADTMYEDKAHAEALRQQAESLEITASARYTAACRQVEARMEELQKEVI